MGGGPRRVRGGGLAPGPRGHALCWAARVAAPARRSRGPRMGDNPRPGGRPQGTPVFSAPGPRFPPGPGSGLARPSGGPRERGERPGVGTPDGRPPGSFWSARGWRRGGPRGAAARSLFPGRQAGAGQLRAFAAARGASAAGEGPRALPPPGGQAAPRPTPGASGCGGGAAPGRQKDRVGRAGQRVAGFRPPHTPSARGPRLTRRSGL